MVRRILSLGLALAVILVLSAQAQAQRPRRDRGDRVPTPPTTPPAVEQPVPPPVRPVEPAPRNDVPGIRANTHTGWFLKTEGDNKFVMRDRNGKQHMHTLAKSAVITCDGKSCKLSDLKRGEMLRVTTRPNDSTVAVRIDATRAANNGRAPIDNRDLTPVPPARPVPPPPGTPAPVPPRRDRR